jgi:hypothetical protein
MLLGQAPFRGDDEDEIFDAILEDEPLYPITMPRDAVSMLHKVGMPSPFPANLLYFFRKLLVLIMSYSCFVAPHSGSFTPSRMYGG